MSCKKGRRGENEETKGIVTSVRSRQVLSGLGCPVSRQTGQDQHKIERIAIIKRSSIQDWNS